MQRDKFYELFDLSDSNIVQEVRQEPDLLLPTTADKVFQNVHETPVFRIYPSCGSSPKEFEDKLEHRSLIELASCSFQQPSNSPCPSLLLPETYVFEDRLDRQVMQTIEGFSIYSDNTMAEVAKGAHDANATGALLPRSLNSTVITQIFFNH
jgi:hypothetical protein